MLSRAGDGAGRGLRPPPFLWKRRLGSSGGSGRALPPSLPSPLRASELATRRHRQGPPHRARSGGGGERDRGCSGCAQVVRRREKGRSVRSSPVGVTTVPPPLPPPFLLERPASLLLQRLRAELWLRSGERLVVTTALREVSRSPRIRGTGREREQAGLAAGRRFAWRTGPSFPSVSIPGRWREPPLSPSFPRDRSLPSAALSDEALIGRQVAAGSLVPRPRGGHAAWRRQAVGALVRRLGGWGAEEAAPLLAPPRPRSVSEEIPSPGRGGGERGESGITSAR